MAILFPWATKEYLLWEMSLPQIIMYHSRGLEAKYPKAKAEKETLKDMSYDELKAKRQEFIDAGLIKR